MSAFVRFIRPLFPAVTTNLCGTMQPTLYRYIWAATSRQQIRLCLLALLLFPLSMAPLEIQRRMVDKAIVQMNFELLVQLGILYIAVLLAHGGIKYAFNVYQSSVGEGVIRVLRLRINTAVQDSRDKLTDNPVALAAAEAEQVGGFVGEAVSFPFLQSGILLTTLAYMIWLEPLLAVVAAASVIPSIILTPVLQRYINKHVQNRVKAIRKLGDQLTDDEAGKETDIARSNDLVEQAYGYRIKVFILKFLLKALNNLLGSLGPVGILMFGGWLVINGHAQLGTIVAFISGFERLTSPTRELLNFYRRISQVNVQYDLLAKTLR